jgi:hypothetical protein
MSKVKNTGDGCKKKQPDATRVARCPAGVATPDKIILAVFS